MKKNLFYIIVIICSFIIGAVQAVADEPPPAKEPETFIPFSCERAGGKVPDERGRPEEEKDTNDISECRFEVITGQPDPLPFLQPKEDRHQTP